MNILEKICQLKHKEINLLKKKFKSSQQKLRTRGFFKSLLMKDSDNFSLIAEIKKSSPSKALICKKFDPIQIAIDYEKDGAKSTIDQSTCIVENVASKDSSASERTDENFAQEGLKHVLLENYFKRKREEKSDPIEFTQVVNKKKTYTIFCRVMHWRTFSKPYNIY